MTEARSSVKTGQDRIWALRKFPLRWESFPRALQAVRACTKFSANELPRWTPTYTLAKNRARNWVCRLGSESTRSWGVRTDDFSE